MVYNLGFMFAGYDNTAFATAIAEIPEHGNIFKNKPDAARNTSSQTITEALFM